MSAAVLCRCAQRCDVVTLAELVQCAVHHSEQPPKAIAEALGVRAGYLHDAANPDRDELQFQLRHLVTLIRFTGRVDLASVLAEMLGGVFFQLPDIAAVPSAALAQETARLASEFADITSEAAPALAAGSVSPMVAARIYHEGRELIAQTARFMHLTDTLAGIAPAPVRLDQRRRA